MAFPTYREHGVAWTRGVDPLHVMGLFRGVDNGGWNPVELGFNLYTIVIGSQCLHATGYAMGVQRDGAESAVLAFLGDGATSQGEVNEAMIFAASFSAPVVFFCQNNQYAISVPLERQSRVPLYQRAAGFGFPGVRVDGNDVLAVLAVTRAALAGRPRGPGARRSSRRSPTGWARTPPPTTPPATGSPASSRSGSCATRSPGSRPTSSRSGIADAAFFDSVDAEGDELAARIRSGTRRDARPASRPSMFDHVYAEQTPQLAAQRAEFVAYHASFEGGEH